MSRQQSQKRGVRSDAQKRATAHSEYEEMPAGAKKPGALGKHGPDRKSDHEAAPLNDGRLEQRKKQWRKFETSEDIKD